MTPRYAVPSTLALLASLALAACAEQSQLPTAPEEGLLARGGPPVAPGSIIPGGIAFISGRTGRTEIFAMNPGGDREAQLTFSEQDELRDNLRIEWVQNRPAFSPDGRKLLVTRRAWDLSVTPNALIHDIHILDLDDPQPRLRRLITNPQPSGTPTWSPDGRKVAYCSGNAGRNEIWIFDIAMGSMTRTNSGPGCWPHWSPDGSRIAYHPGGAGSVIKVLEVATGTVHNVTSHAADNVAQDFNPRWSPDSEWLAFSSNRDKDATGARYRAIFVVRSDGSGSPRNITPIPEGHTVAQIWVNDLPSWSNNGKHIYFQSGRPGSGGFSQIYRTDLEGEEIVQMTEAPAVSIQPDVRPVVRP
jgi:Tol biopolymer transport system component